MKISDVKVDDCFYFINKVDNTREYLRVLIWNPKDGCVCQLNESHYCAVNDNQLSAIETFESYTRVSMEDYKVAMDMYWGSREDSPINRYENAQELIDSFYEDDDDGMNDNDPFTVEVDRDTKDTKVTMENGKSEVIPFEDGSEGSLMAIKVSRMQLIFYKNDGRVPSKELLADIEALDYIVDAPTVTEKNLRAEQFFSVIDLLHEPRKVAQKLRRDKVWK